MGSRLEQPIGQKRSALSVVVGLTMVSKYQLGASMEHQLIPGHSMTFEVRSVHRHSSSWNMDYMSTDSYLVCECGEEFRILAGEKEERIIVIEHSISVLGSTLLQPTVDQPTQTREVQNDESA